MLITIILISVALGFGVLIAIRYASRRAEAISAAHVEARAFMIECEKRILAMKNVNNEFDYRINNLYEVVKYSDSSGASELDWKIDPVLTRLEIALSDDEGEHVPAVIDEAINLFKRRAEEVRDTKRGSF